MQGTKNPGKQRKMLFNAPAHIRHKLMTAPLSPELLAQRGIKALPARKGDTVRIMRGDHKVFEGKISRIDLKHFRVFLEGLTREKVDGSTVFVALHPSKIMIRTLNLDDKRRKAVLERKKPIIKKGQKPTIKPVVKKKSATRQPVELEEEVTEKAKIEVVSPKAAEEKTTKEKIEDEKSEAKTPVAKRKTASKAKGGT